MPPTAARVSPEELAELDRLGQAQLVAAQAVDLGRLGALLRARRQLLLALRGRGLRPQEAAPLTAVDGQTRRLLETQLQRVRGELTALQAARRALRGYGTQTGIASGFIDQLR